MSPSSTSQRELLERIAQNSVSSDSQALKALLLRVLERLEALERQQVDLANGLVDVTTLVMECGAPRCSDSKPGSAIAPEQPDTDVSTFVLPDGTELRIDPSKGVAAYTISNPPAPPTPLPEDLVQRKKLAEEWTRGFWRGHDADREQRRRELENAWEQGRTAGIEQQGDNPWRAQNTDALAPNEASVAAGSMGRVECSTHVFPHDLVFWLSDGTELHVDPDGGVSQLCSPSGASDDEGDWIEIGKHWAIRELAEELKTLRARCKKSTGGCDP